jgi:hypothetical protein
LVKTILSYEFDLDYAAMDVTKLLETFAMASLPDLNAFGSNLRRRWKV